jgi:hypothetical protein
MTVASLSNDHCTIVVCKISIYHKRCRSVKKVVKGEAENERTQRNSAKSQKVAMSGAPVACRVTPNHPGDPNNRNENNVQDAMAIDHHVDTTMPSMYVPAHTGTSAIPITVTTASLPPPSLSSRLFNLQAATSFNETLNQWHLPPVKANFSPSPALTGGPGRGITLPCSLGPASAALNSSLFSQTAVPSRPASALSLKPSASTASLRGYSAASRASINAQDVKTFTPLGRRSASAPTLAISKNKYKYRNVVGGKIPTSKSMVRCAVHP